MADFNEWQLKTLFPGWMQGPLGGGLALALGHLKDAFAQTARQAVKARFPALAPADALPSIGADRLLERVPFDSDGSYRLRLLAAWDLWAKGGTKTGIEDAILNVGYSTVALYDAHTIDLGPGSWARFVVVLLEHAWGSDGVWGDPPAWGDGGTWGSTALLSEVDLILRQVRLWKGAHARCLNVIVPLSGELWGVPPEGLWGDAGVWGGAAAYWLPLPEGNKRMAWVDQVFKWLGYAQYNSTPPTLAEGEVGPLQSDVNGNLKVSVVGGSISAGEPAAASVQQATDLSYGEIVKASAGSLVEIVGFNNSSSDRYLIICNSVTVPANATATTSDVCKVFLVPGGAPFSYSPPRPLVLGTGISWVCSSTRATVTRTTDFYAVTQYLLPGANMPYIASAPPGNIYKNIGSVTRVYWDISTAPSALVRGWDGGSFADPTGETFSINKNGLGAVLVTMGADLDAAAVRTRINGFVAGVAVGSGNRIDIAATNSIAITGMSDSLFAKIGIPEMARNRADIAAVSIQAPIALEGPEIEVASTAIAVPAGANRVTVWGKSAAPTAPVGIDLAVAWGNGLDGASFTNVFALPLQAVLSGTVTGGDADFPLGSQKAYTGILQQIGSGDGLEITRVYELTVPSWATTMRLVVLTAHSEDTGADPPTSPPTFSATVGFGAR